MTAPHHYSTFALDIYWAAKPHDPELEAHVASCEQCGAYLDQLRTFDARPIALPAPARARWWPWAIAATCAAAIAVAVVLLRPASSRDDTYVASKGTPAAQILVRRDGVTSQLDRAGKIRAGDVLALRIACEAMTRVTVLARERDSWKRVSDGECQDGVLPFTLIVDEQPGDEQLAVVFGIAALDDTAATSAADHQTQDRDVWALRLVLAKELRR